MSLITALIIWFAVQTLFIATRPDLKTTPHLIACLSVTAIILASLHYLKS